MKIHKPYHFSSQFPHSIAEHNLKSGDPYLWFDTEFFRNEGVFTTSFDFLIDWNRNVVYPEIWIKRICYSDISDNVDETYQSIVNCDGFEFIRRIKDFSAAHGCNLKYIIIPAVSEEEWARSVNPPTICMFDLFGFLQARSENKPYNERVMILYTVSEFIALLKSVKKKSSFMGAKGMKYVTSTLELFLSKPCQEISYSGDAIYPGDVDILLFSPYDHSKATAIIEIKKHSLGSQRKAPLIQDETIGLWGGIDTRKYESFRLLMNYLRCSFYVLFFPTTNDDNIKLEQIGFRDGLSYVMSSHIIVLPNRDDPNSLRIFQQQICRIMEDTTNEV